MKAAPCPRSFEVEAASDGRLIGAERASFERHLAACPHCTQEAQALLALAKAVHALPTGTRDELYVRRERTRLLAAFDGELVSPGHRRSMRPLLWGSAFAVLGMSLLALWLARPTQPTPALSTFVRAASDAIWSRQREGSLDRIRLTCGSLWIRVDHSQAHRQRVLVALPDGELEDIGTTFRVSAQAQRTTLVAVEQGSVVLRLRGSEPLVLHAGQRFVPQPPPAQPARTNESASASPAPTANVPAAAVPERASDPKRPRSARLPGAAILAPDPALDFRAAMAMFHGGDHGGAAASFARFVAQHPRAAQAQDAAYLQVLALQRHHDDDAAVRAARSYLQRFPNGFRRAEMEAVAQPR